MVYRRILVPLDGSVRAEAILPHVEELARRFRAEVVLLLVVEPSTPWTVPQGTRLDIRAVNEAAAEAERYLAELQGRFQEQGVVARRLVEYGPVVETIHTVAEREAADLLAMASHGRSGLSQVFYGSVAAGVLQRIDRPLLLIRAAEAT
ncbi:MAG: universal stress protein [Candidatus Promineifilaceae bacterium]|nr:universal stress protein [Candidatus Promineifilaceae bacterium]